MKPSKKIIIVLSILVVFSALFAFAYVFNIIPHRSYTAADFNLPVYTSSIDKDSDGIDDQTDILSSVREYLATNPKYKSAYYATGYPDDGYGVCTDVIAFGLKGAGYDLMELVYSDISAHPENYGINIIDKNIDFRRVNNLNVYFRNNHISLTTDLSDLEAWQGGDIIVFPTHIGIISDKRNKHGIPFLIHHKSPFQPHYEEDVLELYNQNDIIGHYRIS